MNLRNIKQQPIVDYLQQQGYTPQHIRGNAYWYCSPFRNDKQPRSKSIPNAISGMILLLANMATS